MPTIQLIDESTAGGETRTSTLELEADQITVGELIALRVRAEVRRHNNERLDGFFGLVQLLKKAAGHIFEAVDADKQVEVALQGFRSQKYVVLLPAKQAESVDEVICLADGDEVSFLRLMPLVGG